MSETHVSAVMIGEMKRWAARRKMLWPREFRSAQIVDCSRYSGQGLCSRRLTFEGLLTKAAEMTVTTRTIIENFDIVKDIGACHFARFVDSFSYPFFLKATKDAFGNSIVPTVSAAAHAGLEIMSFAKAFEVIAAELRSLIRMHNHLLSRLTAPYSHQQCIDG